MVNKIDRIQAIRDRNASPHWSTEFAREEDVFSKWKEALDKEMELMKAGSGVGLQISTVKPPPTVTMLQSAVSDGIHPTPEFYQIRRLRKAIDFAETYGMSPPRPQPVFGKSCFQQHFEECNLGEIDLPKYVVPDYSGVELRVLAHSAKKSYVMKQPHNVLSKPVWEESLNHVHKMRRLWEDSL